VGEWLPAAREDGSTPSPSHRTHPATPCLASNAAPCSNVHSLTMPQRRLHVEEAESPVMVVDASDGLMLLLVVLLVVLGTPPPDDGSVPSCERWGGDITDETHGQ
jgi:hypothetical protein